MQRDRARIAVIGAGFGGIATAYYLRRAGLGDFEVFERNDGPGGVWWANRYPGAEVDTPNHVYSFSFMPFDWSRSHVQRDELLTYMKATLDRFDLWRHFHFNTTVTSVDWDDTAQTYSVEIDRERREFDFVISCVGLLSEPRFPDWPGMETFRGPRFHTSQWQDHDLHSRRVAVVGTGSTSAQLVPRIAEQGAEVVVFQREPGWIDPKPVALYSDEERRALSKPLRYRLKRISGYRAAAKARDRGRIHMPGSESNRRATELRRAYISSVFADHPELSRALTPDYPFYGKRPIHDSRFYEALKRDNVSLVPRAVESVTPDGLVDTNGTTHKIDVLVLATGFRPSQFLAQLRVTGRGGLDIHEQWADDPAAFLGVTVPRFPNFFMLYGPNTNNPVVLFFLERQAEFAVRSIRRVLRRGASAVEVKPLYHDIYNAWLQEHMRDSVWELANNYYKSRSGRVVTQWPVSPTVYWALSRLLVHRSARLSWAPPGSSTRSSADGRATTTESR
jgi:cation diffusion facilitator CzcD-associated flavoprotein CzcO